jgi:hypothetical protein
MDTLRDKNLLEELWQNGKGTLEVVGLNLNKAWVIYRNST